MPTGNNSFIVDAKGNVGTVAPQGNVTVGETFPFLMTSYHQSITAASGGTNLPSVPCGKIELQNLSGNHIMWWGGVAPNHAPSSGRGNELFPMSVIFYAEKTIYISNANQISVCASVSGEMIAFVAYGNGQNTAIDPKTQGKQPDNTQPLAPQWS